MVRINGEEVQHCNTSDMLFTFAEIVSYISQQVTLRSGDLVFSGATGTTIAIKPGDQVEVDIPGRWRTVQPGSGGVCRDCRLKV